MYRLSLSVEPNQQDRIKYSKKPQYKSESRVIFYWPIRINNKLRMHAQSNRTHTHTHSLYSVNLVMCARCGRPFEMMEREREPSRGAPRASPCRMWLIMMTTQANAGIREIVESRKFFCASNALLSALIFCKQSRFGWGPVSKSSETSQKRAFDRLQNPQWEIDRGEPAQENGATNAAPIVIVIWIASVVIRRIYATLGLSDVFSFRSPLLQLFCCLP